MLKASSLFYAVTMSLLIGMLSGGLILFAYLNRTYILQSLSKAKVKLNAGSGMNILLTENELFEKSDTLILSLFEDGADSVRLIKKSWGAFDLGISESFIRKERHKEVALIGTALDDSSKISLYLSDQNKALSVCGKTVIQGNCYLPKAGVKRAYIEGQTYLGDKLVYGTAKQSSRDLPPINKKMIEANKAYLTKKFNSADSMLYFHEQEISDSIVQSFNDKTLLIYSERPIVLLSNKYAGNICIVSDTSVFIGSEAWLKDVLIYSPIIKVEKKFSGNFQAFAYDTIVIGENCQLTYPTVLGIIKIEKSADVSVLEVKEKTEISGVLFQYEEISNYQKLVKLQLGEGSIVNGQVYSNGMVEIKGSVYGSVICKEFTLATASSVYGNHLLNATIDFNRLSEYFTGVNLISQSNYRQVAKWLN
jgi:hypothetical protein